MELDAAADAQAYADECIRCGLCAQTDCGNYAPDTPPLGDICASVLEGDETWRHFPYTCALCGRCTVSCPVGLEAARGMKPLRALILGRHPELRRNYRHFRTDLKDNLFSLMQGRAVGEPGTRHLVKGETGLGAYADETAFFPGCSLNSYAPAVTEAVSRWLREEGIAARTLSLCCGATFYDTGFYPEFETFRTRVQELLGVLGIRRLVLCCPHCAHVLPDLLDGTGVELVRLPDLLLERGVTSSFAGTLAVHDACYDRATGVFGKTVRQLFPQATLVALGHEGSESLCCGGGGMVSAYSPDHCTYRRTQRLAEVDAAAPELLLSTCFSCVNSMQRGKGSIPVKHYLELLFGVDVDWREVYRQVDALYADPAANGLLAGSEEMLTPDYLRRLAVAARLKAPARRP